MYRTDALFWAAAINISIIQSRYLKYCRNDNIILYLIGIIIKEQDKSIKIVDFFFDEKKKSCSEIVVYIYFIASVQ